MQFSTPFLLHSLLIFFFFPIIFDEEYKLCRSSLCSFLQLPVTSSFFGTNIPLTSSPQTSFLNVRDQVSQPYRTTGKIIVLYILINSKALYDIS
jgi:hypothetical protein